MITELLLLLPAAASGETQALRAPVAFVENRGQWRPSIRYVAKAPGYTAWFEADRFWVKRIVRERSGPLEREERARLRAAVVCFELLGAAETIDRGEPVPGMHHYLLGERIGWVTHVTGYASIVYRDVAPGVHLRFREGARGLEYDLLAEPGADPGAVRFEVHGAQGLEVSADGGLRIDTALGPMEHTAPVAWEELGPGERRPVPSAFRPTAEARGFSLVALDRDAVNPLVVDPGIVWGTYLGGSNGESPTAGVDVDERGDMYVAGVSHSNDFPTTPGAFDSQGGSPLYNDTFVTKLAADGASLVYSTYLGGIGEHEYANALAVDSEGRAVVVGSTSNASFPTTPGAVDPVFGGTADEAFVVRFSKDGSSLFSSTLLGEEKHEGAYALVLDEDQNAVVGGQTWSPDFPVTPGAFQTTFGGGQGDGFVAVVSPDATAILGATYFGGSGEDWIRGVSWHAAHGYAFVGNTRSSDLPITPGAVDPEVGPSHPDALVGRLASLTGPLTLCTYLGGDVIEGADVVDQDALGRVAVGGGTNSPDFPVTADAFDTTFDTQSAGFVTVLDASGTSFVYSTLFEGASIITSSGIGSSVTLSSGVVTAAGAVTTAPVTPGALEVSNSSAVVIRLHPSGSKLMYAGTIGGESTRGFARDDDGAVLAVVDTFGSDFETTPGAFDPASNGGQDAGVVKVELLPTGVARLGASTPACDGPVWADVDSMPYSGNDGFHVTCEGAPPSAAGALGIGFTSDPVGIPALNVTLHVPAPVLIVPTTSDAYGWAEVPLPIAPTLAVGAQVFAQHVWINTPDCGAPAPLSASDALAITIQPALP